MRIGIAMAMLTVAALAAGCRSGGKPAATVSPTSPAGSPSPLATTADPQAVARQKALDAYRGMWRAYVDATHEANPDSPELARYASGDALNTLIKGLRQIRDQGLRSRGDVVLTPKVEAVEPAAAPTRASISDCVDTSGASAYKVSGEPYQDTPGGRRAMAATVREVGAGIWKVTSFGLRGIGTC